MGRIIQFYVGNTYRKIPFHEAKLNHVAQKAMTHEWILFVDIVLGDPDLIKKVTFELGALFTPDTFVCACPVSVTRPDGSQAWRFSTRQQSHCSVKARIKIRCTGPTGFRTKHEIVLSPKASRSHCKLYTFFENYRPKPLQANKLPDQQKFGVELELTCPVESDLETVAARVHSVPIDVIHNYSHGRSVSSHWKMVPDASIVCSVSLPDCNTFELVSPILQGGSGLRQVSIVLQGLRGAELKVNKSMGFHVHVDVSSLSLEQLIKVCQNFCKYENVMDTLQPPSRRSGSAESKRYFQSNSTSVRQTAHPSTRKQLLNAIASCGSLVQLVDLMNLDGRYYKLNLQNLKTGRQPTIEFRQHSATMKYEKVSHWVRFCVAFVRNAANLDPPTPFAKGRSLDYQFLALFQYVVKDRALRNYYQARREELADDIDDDEEEACCGGCSRGGQCVRKSHVFEL